jgi:hypothetical protein
LTAWVYRRHQRQLGNWRRRYKGLNDPSSRAGTIHVFKNLKYHGYPFDAANSESARRITDGQLQTPRNYVGMQLGSLQVPAITQRLTHSDRGQSTTGQRRPRRWSDVELTLSPIAESVGTFRPTWPRVLTITIGPAHFRSVKTPQVGSPVRPNGGRPGPGGPAKA